MDIERNRLELELTKKNNIYQSLKTENDDLKIQIKELRQEAYDLREKYKLSEGQHHHVGQPYSITI